MRRVLLVSSLVALAGCNGLPFGSEPPPPARPDAAVLHRAEVDRSEHLERELDRLRADLAQAEQAMVAIESGLRADHTRANAVSAIAEARIAVERAGRAAPWRSEELAEAERKLAEADRQLQAGHFGSAVFFASRSHRIADLLSRETKQVARADDARFVRVKRLNLREEPSKTAAVLGVLGRDTPVFLERQQGEWGLVRTPGGQVGWVFVSLLRTQAPASPAGGR